MQLQPGKKMTGVSKYNGGNINKYVDMGSAKGPNTLHNPSQKASTITLNKLANTEGRGAGKLSKSITVNQNRK
jgi:hypothetical protein